MSKYIFRSIGFEVSIKKSNRDWKCKSCGAKILTGDRRVVVNYKKLDLFASDSHCLLCGEKEAIKFPGEEFYDRVRFETALTIENRLKLDKTEDQEMEDKLTFKPDFCFVSIHCSKLPLFDEVDGPTKIIRTPYGFDCYFEARPFDIDEQNKLATKYKGNPKTRRLYKVGSKIDHLGEEFTFKVYERPEFEQDHRNINPGLHMLYVKWACAHLITIDKCITSLIRSSGGGVDGPVISLRAERAKLIASNAAYCDAHDIMNEIRTAKGKKKYSTDGYKVDASSSKEEL